MKNIILIGACRAGKSTLAQFILNEFPTYQYINRDIVFDSYCNAQRKCVSELSNSKGVDGININVNVPKYMVMFMYSYFVSDYQNMNIIVDAGDITLSDAREIVKTNLQAEYIIIALGYPDIDANEKLEQVRENEGERDWTKSYSNVKLKNFFEYQIKYSKELEKECGKYNIMFVNTSYDREEKIMKVIEFVKNDNS